LPTSFGLAITEFFFQPNNSARTNFMETQTKHPVFFEPVFCAIHHGQQKIFTSSLNPLFLF